ncbi:hypothetical protein EZS27_009962 [termite gut metagenome]|uniref:DUF4160 domain-containing protein n=1 Tax=termite gut metagenome TaxID=433724 RepID=A0A5J4S863_9ZZZZ
MSPTVFLIRNIRFFFFSREEKRIHIHIRQLNKRAKFWVEPSIELAYNNGFNDSELKEIKMEIINNENTIREKWNSYFES